MSSKRTLTRDGLNALPRIQQERHGVAIISSGQWDLLSGSREEAISTQMNIRGFKYDSIVSNHPKWEVHISKARTGGKLLPAWEATFFVKPNDGPLKMDPVVLLRGSDIGWDAPIASVSEFSDIVSAMRRCGQQRLFGHEGAGWEAVRPFKIEWPYEDHREPNAKYSNYYWCGPSFDHESDGVVAFCYGASSHTMRHLCSSYAGANARLEGPDAQGKYWIWHRGEMLYKDETDIDDWRGRIVASAGDSNED
jgi:hypothetical protein